MYMPDIPNITRTEEVYDVDCQTRCQEIDSCQYFTYLPNTYCTLQGAGASAITAETATGGPKECPAGTSTDSPRRRWPFGAFILWSLGVCACVTLFTFVVATGLKRRKRHRDFAESRSTGNSPTGSPMSTHGGSGDHFGDPRGMGGFLQGFPGYEQMHPQAHSTPSPQYAQVDGAPSYGHNGTQGYGGHQSEERDNLGSGYSTPPRTGSSNQHYAAGSRQPSYDLGQNRYRYDDGRPPPASRH